MTEVNGLCAAIVDKLYLKQVVSERKILSQNKWFIFDES